MNRAIEVPRLRAALSPLLLSLLAFGCAPPGGQPPPQSAPDFVISSPADGAELAAPTFFSVQPLRPADVVSVAFEADGTPLEVDFAGEDALRVFFLPGDFPAGPVTLTATVTGVGGSRSRSVTVENVPNPPGSGTIGPDGGVLGATEANGGVSTITLPPGFGDGATLSFDIRSEAEVLAATGVDYAALGVTFLGAQEVGSDRELSGAVGISSGGFGPQVQPGQAVVNYAIVPDADGDGVGELVVINRATVAPNGDVISDPLPRLQSGAAAATSVRGSSHVRTLQAGLSGPPGARLDIEVSGFNPFSLGGNVAEFGVAGSTTTIPGRVLAAADDPGAQTLVVAIPWLPVGPATLRLRELGSGQLLGPFDVVVEPPVAVSDPRGEALDWFDRAAAFVATLPEPDGFEQAPEVKERALQRLATLRSEVAALDGAGAAPQATLERVAQLLAASGGSLPGLRTAQLPPAIAEPLLDMQSSLDTIRDDLLDLYDETGNEEYLDMANEIDGLNIDLFWMTMEVGFGDGCGALLRRQQSCEDRPAPQPAPGNFNVPGTTGMGSGPPPGGPGFGHGRPRRTPDAPRLESQQLTEPGRLVVKIFSTGIGSAFTGMADAGGYFFVPMLPAGQPFTAVAIDTVTREQWTFQGVGPSLGDQVPIFFDTVPPGGSGPVELPLDSNTSGVLLPGEGIDQYSFEGVAGQRVALALLADPNSLLTGGPFATTTIELFAPSGAKLLRRNLFASRRYAESGIVELPEPGTYFVEVASNRSGSYRVGLAAIEDPTPIAVSGTSTSFDGEITVLGDVQLFRFDGSAGAPYNMVVDHPGGSELSVETWLKAPAPSSCCARIWTTFDERIVASFPFVLPVDDLYTIEVRSQGVVDDVEHRTGGYRITLQSPVPQPLSVDSEHVTGIDPHDFALFKVDLAADDLHNVALLATTPDLRFVAALFGPTPGQTSAFVSAISSNLQIGAFAESRVFDVAESGTHLLAIWARGGDSGSLRLALTSVAPPTPIVPSAPSLDLAGDLTLLGQRAFYSFVGSENDLHTFDLDHPGGSQLNATLWVREPSGFVPQPPFYELGVLGSAQTDGSDRSASTGELTLPRDGTYIVEVASDAWFDELLGEHTGAFGVTILTP